MHTIKMLLQNVLRDEGKLEALLKIKERQKEEAMHINDTQRLVTEIEMLQMVVYYLVRSRGGEEEDKVTAPRSISVKGSLSKKEKRESLFIYSVLVVQRLMDFGSL